MIVAREGLPFVLGFVGAGVAGGLLVGAVTWPAWWPGAAVFLLLDGLGLFSLWFFRDPERTCPGGEDLVLSPADGRVVAVREDPEGPALAIFLNVFDVHVNRSPVAGRVTSVLHSPGRFLAAFREEAGEANERNELILAGPAGPVAVRQIAGAIARRIVCRAKPGDHLQAGERFGLIRFGSRTDLRLPRGARLEVKVGDRVRGGETVVARLDTGPRAGAAG